MKTEITIYKPEEYGIEQSKAQELYGNLPQIISERSELEKQFDDVIKMDVESPESWVKARNLRLLIQKNRTQGIMVWHKNAKDYFLKGSQFVDSIKRKEVAVNERMENDLIEIEKYEQIQNEKRLAKLQEERVKQLLPYVENAPELNLSGMEEDVWEAYLSTKKKAWEDEQERIRKEEEERVERERIEKLHDTRKNELLPYWQFMDDVEKALHYGKMPEVDFGVFHAELVTKKEKHDAEQERIRKENERLKKEADTERKEKERIQNELKAKADAEQKAKDEEEKRIQAELNKGDADKVLDLIADLEKLKTRYVFESEANKKMYADVSGLIDKVINFINK